MSESKSPGSIRPVQIGNRGSAYSHRNRKKKNQKNRRPPQCIHDKITFIIWRDGHRNNGGDDRKRKRKWLWNNTGIVVQPLTGRNRFRRVRVAFRATVTASWTRGQKGTGKVFFCFLCAVEEHPCTRMFIRLSILFINAVNALFVSVNPN